MKNSFVIDLFSGAGGLSLGAARAGFKLAGAVEIDKNAIKTHKKNFPNSVHLEDDVSHLSGEKLLEKCNVPLGQLAGLIGGPPCQGFSSIGKKDPNDSRNKLFDHFMRLVEEAMPMFFLAENVPGIMLEKNRGIVDAALNRLRETYFLFDPLIVEAHKYGAPTTRTRLFFIGVRQDLYLNPNKDYFKFPLHKAPVNIELALEGLPSDISAEWKGKSTWAKVDKLTPSHFAERVEGFIPEGVGDTDAIAKHSKEGLVSGCVGTVHSPNLEKRYGDLKQGAKDPISRSIRLAQNGFCPTLRAGTGPDKGSYQAVRPIHPTRPRVITPREAARLQGFPDWFVLPDAKWHAFRQIGNSVSPLVAEVILSKINELIKDLKSQS